MRWLYPRSRELSRRLTRLRKWTSQLLESTTSINWLERLFLKPHLSPIVTSQRMHCLTLPAASAASVRSRILWGKFVAAFTPLDVLSSRSHQTCHVGVNHVLRGRHPFQVEGAVVPFVAVAVVDLIKGRWGQAKKGDGDKSVDGMRSGLMFPRKADSQVTIGAKRRGDQPVEASMAHSALIRDLIKILIICYRSPLFEANLGLHRESSPSGVRRADVSASRPLNFTIFEASRVGGTA